MSISFEHIKQMADEGKTIADLIKFIEVSEESDTHFYFTYRK